MTKTIHLKAYRQLVRRLTEVRQDAGLTQQAVADRLLKPQSYVAKVEGFERKLDVIELLDFAGAINFDPTPILRDIWRERLREKRGS